MQITINPTQLKGSVQIPPSKSLSHRSIIAASLAPGISKISNIILSEDIIATIEAMRQLGVKIDIEKGNRCLLTVHGTSDLEVQSESIQCNESGSTLRFLVPFFTLVSKPITYLGRNKLIERPLDSYYEIFEKQGIKFSHDQGKLPLTVEGNLKPGAYYLDGNISSQFITGLMFVLPLLNGDSEIIIRKELESKGYVDLTIDILHKYGINIVNENYEKFIIKGNQCYQPADYTVEGDYSQGAFFIVANLIGNEIEIKGLSEKSLQGDQEILDIVEGIGASYHFNGDELVIEKNGPLKPMAIDAKDCPDLVPILGVLGSFIDGNVTINNAERLRIKESDRLKAISTELNKLGCNLEEKADGLIIKNIETLKGGHVHSWNDHRIAMALSIFSTQLSEPITLEKAEAINKSYPDFYEDFKKLGGKING